MSTQDYGPRAVSDEPDRYLQWDGAYVLGALSSSERREYERHLAGCQGCQRSVSELAGLPGLLAQASPEDAALLTGAVEQLDDESPPQFGSLLARVRRRRRRILLLVGSVAAALVLLAGTMGVLVYRGILPIGAQDPYRVAFSPVAPNGITAVVDVTPGRTETAFQVECQYARVSETAPSGSYGKYAIWVRERSGQETELYSWYAKPNKVMRPQAVAQIGTRKLESVEIREAHTGELLLTAPLR
jgi:hypothetical protein